MPPETAPPADESEAYQVLMARVGRKSPKIPADLLVRHVLRIVPAVEWPTRVDALDAVLRRVDSIKKDGLKVASRPKGGAPLGSYTTKTPGPGVRPYQILVTGVDPIVGSCDCPDYLKNSLGACKHVMVVLEHLHARPKVLQAARAEQKAGSAPIGLHWDPIRPLTGPGDWLERVSWVRPSTTRAARSAAETRALKWFLMGDCGSLVVRKAFAEKPEKRLELVRDLQKLSAVAAGGEPPEPALAALLGNESDRLGRRVKSAPTASETKAAIQGLKRPLYAYQRTGVERFLNDGRLLLADDMGLGKTAQAISSCDILWRSKRVRRGLIIAPASLKPQWAREWAQFSDLPIRVVDGTPSERAALYETEKSGLFIINYEQLIRDLESIRGWNPDLVVLDEAQRIKNWATKTALSVKGLAPPYRLVLTGTPMENRIEELASVVEWVDDMALEPKWRLNSVHAIRADGRREVTGVRHLDTLRDRLRGCMLRRVRQDVLDQLPPRTDTRVPVEMTEPQKDEHDALIAPIAQILQRAKSRVLTQPEFLRLMSLLTAQRIISNGLAQLRFDEDWPAIRNRAPDEGMLRGLASPKLLELRQLVRQIALEQGRKIVIFSQWRRMLTLSHWAVSDLLAEDGLRAGFFTGAEGQRRRTQNIVEFHDDPSYRILFASDAGGVGLNLQHASNCVINLELPWNPAVLEQRIGRIYRLGQTRPIDVFNLVCEEGIESRIAGLVGSKQAFFKGLFDGDTDSVQFDQSSSFLAKVETIYGASANSRAASNGDGEAIADDDIDLDDEVSDPFDQILDKSDEATDGVVPAVERPAPAPVLTGLPAEPPRLDSDGPADAPGPRDVPSLFAQVKIRKEADGRILMEAPPEAASSLVALFEGMAALLRSAAESTSPDGEAPAP